LRADVTFVKTPAGGIQPQAVMDSKGNVHLLYFRGDPKAGNLMYVRKDAGKDDFSDPIKVNSQEGSAIAVGTIRGGHLAVGKNGRVHVSWNGSGKAQPKNPIEGTPMLYSRLDDKGTAFERQRNLMTQSAILDGGGTLAADKNGNVYVAWHALDRKLPRGEENRRVWVSVSKDDGKTFAAEIAVDGNTGACGCCGMRGFADSKGRAYFLYRAASEKVNRGMYALVTEDGKDFAGRQLDNWKIGTCPMSSEAIAEAPDGRVIGAWENDGQIFFADFWPKDQDRPAPLQAPGKGGNRQHPAIAFNKKEEMILVWAEGTGWNRGGGLAWQTYDSKFEPLEFGRRGGAVPVWGLPTVVAEANGDFTIYH
jgi:hypothetical protein